MVENGTEKRDTGDTIAAFADLVETSVAYVRQEAGDLVQDKVVEPTRKAGAFVAFAIAAASALVVGLLFIATGALILLASLIGWPGALFAVGGVFVLVAAGCTYAKVRSAQS